MTLAIDQGTTGTTCLVFDEQAEMIGRAYSEFEQHFPRPGWVEHDPAGVGIGLWTVEQVRSAWREKCRYDPQMGDEERARLLGGWRQALERARSR